MARTDNLTNYLTDVADAIRTKTGSKATIQASNFDTEIEDIETIDDGFVVEDNKYNIKGTSSVTITLNRAKNYAPCLLLKKVPYFEMTCEGNYGCGGIFSYCVNLEEIDVSGIDVTTNTNNYFRNMFMGCISLKEINLSSWRTMTGTATASGSSVAHNIGYMFDGCTSLKRADLRCFSRNFDISNLFTGCTSLEHIDLRNLDLTGCVGYAVMFGTNLDVPTTCEIIVADTTQKEWFATNFSDYTNVKTVAEYENEQN